jgi:hypothetical protein
VGRLNRRRGGTAPVEKADDKNVNVGTQLPKLKSPDPDARLEALRSLEYSLDPRLPEVMLGLLWDRGDTIRRVAAHGIGSRWWQISKPQVNTFTARLREAEKTEGDGLAEECHRSINLLLQAVGKNIEFPDAVSVSPNGRWIIYDRLGGGRQGQALFEAPQGASGTDQTCCLADLMIP